MDTSLFTSIDIGIKYSESALNGQVGSPLKLSYLVLIYVRDGNALVSINFKTYRINKASVLVLSEDDMVMFQRKTPDFRIQCFMIDKPFASDIAFDLPNNLFSYLHHYPVQRLNKLQQQQLFFWDQQCHYILNHCAVYLKRMLCSHFQNLFLAISEQMNQTVLQKEQQFSRKEELCWKFWDLIGKHARMHRDVAFYAEQLHITPFYLSQITKDFLAEVPKDLINRQVVLEIKALLKSTDKSINEIAYKLNFVDPSYMGRYFKRETGLSLTEFRKQL
uniref:helix-turn-helix domain-containing protein n=1 Tax=Pedobacter schmidteae TaxID=2201271 RepID=UPI000EB48050|nr:helix-turn-helix domain-containing protein [Pedobacter schmidteae]